MDETDQRGFAPPWGDAEWLASAREWVRVEAFRLGHEVRGEIKQVHHQPWSTLLRAPTARGALYFKAVIPALSHEPRLTAQLAKRFPDLVLPVLAMDDDRGWMLQPDGGPTLRASGTPRERLAVWHAALTRFAAMQQTLLGKGDALLELGVVDRRLSRLPEQFARLLDDEEALRIGEEDGLSVEEVERLRATQDWFAAGCRTLAELGIAESLHHDDFHDANVLLGYDGGERGLRFIDWGDTCVAHPFFSLLVALRSVGYRLEDETGLKPDDEFPAVAALREAYLSQWTDYASLNELREACQLATPLAMISRAIFWRDDLYSLVPQARAGNTHTVPAWLRIYLGSGPAR